MAVFPDIHEVLDAASGYQVTGGGDLPSFFRVSDLAVETTGAAASQLAAYAGSERLPVVDRRLTSLWFKHSILPLGWDVPSLWDSVAGDYQTADGWIRLHTNAPHHRKAALAVLDLPADAEREAVATALQSWQVTDLETAIVAAGGCAAEMRSAAAWALHPQGRAVAQEPLIHWQENSTTVSSQQKLCDPSQPLNGVRVLDLTRVLAGPTATRFLAAFGADVLRIDPPWWHEPPVEIEMTVGKRCAGLDFRIEADRARLIELAADADILVHGYRPQALDGLGLGPQALRTRNPKLIDVSLCAYGWTGPWAGRRGFDSLMQMSSGIADLGMKQAGATVPTPLPVQALDYATGYLAAAACLQALRLRRDEGRVLSARLSLARTGELLKTTALPDLVGDLKTAERTDYADDIEDTAWGKLKRLKFPVQFNDIKPHWRYPAAPLRSVEPIWA